MTDKEEKLARAAKGKAPVGKVSSKSTAKTSAKPAKKDGAVKREPPKRPEYKYGVQDLALETGLKEASVRVGLRKANIAKAEGNVYGWNTKSDLDSVLNAAWPKPTKKSA